MENNIENCNDYNKLTCKGTNQRIEWSRMLSVKTTATK